MQLAIRGSYNSFGPRHSKNHKGTSVFWADAAPVLIRSELFRTFKPQLLTPSIHTHDLKQFRFERIYNSR